MKTLSIVIPVYNEGKTIRSLLDRVAEANVDARLEIIIVNDGSTDESPEIIEKWLADHPDAALIHQDNAGKGSAVRAGIQRSTGDAVIIQDADLEYDPDDYQACVRPIFAGEAKVVYGSRELSEENRRYSHASFYAGGLLVTNWINLLFGSDLTDEPTCYKTFAGDLIRSLPLKGDGFEWEPEVTAKLLRLGCDIQEVPIHYSPRKSAEGKKIKWTDGLNALWTAARWRLAPLNQERRAVAALSEANRRRLKRSTRVGRGLTLIFLLALIARLLLIIPGLREPGKTFTRTDSGSYVKPAMSLIHQGSYSTSPESETPATKRPPGFSLFLAAVLAVNGGGLRLPVGLLCLISALICLPVFLIGRRFGGDAVGLLAALLHALNLTSMAVAPLVISDTLFAFIVAWQLFFFTRFAFSPRLPYLLLSLALAAASTLVRPISLLWILPAVFLVMITTRLSIGKRLIFSAAAAALFVAIIAPWMFRNHQVGAGFRLDTNVGDTLLYHNCAVLKAALTGREPSAARKEFKTRVKREFSDNPGKYANENQKIAFMTGLALDMILEHPLRYALLHVRPQVLIPDAASFFEVLGLTRTGRGTFDVLNQKGVWAAVEHYFGDKLWLILPIIPLLAVAGITYAGCLGQLLVWICKREWFLVFFFLAFVEYFLFLPGPITMPRYQLPALPLMAVMAAMFWLSARNFFITRHQS